jgi:hypothetical protein
LRRPRLKLGCGAKERRKKDILPQGNVIFFIQNAFFFVDEESGKSTLAIRLILL